MITIQSKLNHQITARELRVIDETGKNLGVMTKDDALKIAVERGLDLIEVTASATPPIARIMSFDKFRYEQEKKLKKQRAAQKSSGLKEVQISVKEARHDLDMKVKRIEEFFVGGHPVVISMRLRGREKANKDWALGKLKEFLTIIPTPFNQTMQPRWSGRGFVTQIVKK